MEVAVRSSCYPVTDPLDRYDSLFQYYGAKYGVSWKLLKAQGIVESGLNPNAVNPTSGAKGIAQFIEQTWREWQDGIPGIEEQPPPGHIEIWDPEDAIRAQAAYMAWLLRQVRNDAPKALAAYNWGIGNLMRMLEERGWPQDWERYCPQETQRYITRVVLVMTHGLDPVTGRVQRENLRQIYETV